jgi:acyl carrier protein
MILARSLRRAGGVEPDSDVFALGADSMIMMSVVAQLEEQFDIELAPEDLVKETLRTPRTIVALLGNKYNVMTGQVE